MNEGYLPATLSHLADDYRCVLEQETDREALHREMSSIRDEIDLRIEWVDTQFLAYAKGLALARSTSLEEQLFEMVLRVAHERHEARLEIADKPVPEPFLGVSFPLPEPEPGTPEGELMILVYELNPVRRLSGTAGASLLWLLSYFRTLGRPVDPPQQGSS